MIREYLASNCYPENLSGNVCQENADLFACMQLYSQALVPDGKSHDGKNKTKEAAREAWQEFYKNNKAETRKFFRERNELRSSIHDTSALPAVSLPEHSWSLQFTFKLRKPYLSGDETDFYLFENPVRKDWVFKLPYIAASQWKGMLRSVLVRGMVANLQDRRLDEESFGLQRHALWRLFGNENDGAADYLNLSLAKLRSGSVPDDVGQYAKWFECVEKETEKIGHLFQKNLVDKGLCLSDMEGFRGCLYFYPTYFEDIGLEVINPHRRDTGAGTQPILMECVPKDTCGEFKLLYAPLTGSNRDVRVSDLDIVVSGLWTLLAEVGIGAKTSSGFGLANIMKQGVYDQNSQFLSSLEEFRTRCRELVEKEHVISTQLNEVSMKIDGE